MIERLPPQSIEAEQSVIGSILIDRDAVIEVAELLRPDDFYRQAHATIYSAMLGLFERREPIDILTVAEELERGGELDGIGGRAYLSSLSNLTPTAVHAVQYARIVERKAEGAADCQHGRGTPVYGQVSVLCKRCLYLLWLRHPDFEVELRQMKPDYFVVNADGHIPEKRAICEELGIEYVVLERKPYEGLEARSTTALRQREYMPYRIDLAGGWLDQPYVSEHYPGSVITISLEPTIEFNERSGMASSTRRSALDLWGPKLPPGNYEKLAKILFCYENPPGTKVISGSQDSIGIVFPGLAKAYYEGGYWPTDLCKENCTALRAANRQLSLI